MVVVFFVKPLGELCHVQVRYGCKVPDNTFGMAVSGSITTLLIGQKFPWKLRLGTNTDWEKGSFSIWMDSILNFPGPRFGAKR